MPIVVIQREYPPGPSYNIDDINLNQSDYYYDDYQYPNDDVYPRSERSLAQEKKMEFYEPSDKLPNLKVSHPVFTTEPSLQIINLLESSEEISDYLNFYQPKNLYKKLNFKKMNDTLFSGAPSPEYEYNDEYNYDDDEFHDDFAGTPPKTYSEGGLDPYFFKYRANNGTLDPTIISFNFDFSVAKNLKFDQIYSKKLIRMIRNQSRTFAQIFEKVNLNQVEENLSKNLISNYQSSILDFKIGGIPLKTLKNHNLKINQFTTFQGTCLNFNLNQSLKQYQDSSDFGIKLTFKVPKSFELQEYLEFKKNESQNHKAPLIRNFPKIALIENFKNLFAEAPSGAASEDDGQDESQNENSDHTNFKNFEPDTKLISNFNIYFHEKQEISQLQSNLENLNKIKLKENKLNKISLTTTESHLYHDALDTTKFCRTDKAVTMFNCFYEKYSKFYGCDALAYFNHDKVSQRESHLNSEDTNEQFLQPCETNSTIYEQNYKTLSPLQEQAIVDECVFSNCHTIKYEPHFITYEDFIDKATCSGEVLNLDSLKEQNDIDIRYFDLKDDRCLFLREFFGFLKICETLMQFDCFKMDGRTKAWLVA